VAGAVSFVHLRRWLAAIVVILGIATVIAGEPPSTSGAVGGDLRSAMGTTASGASGTEAVVPVRARLGAGSGFERAVRAKLPLLVGPGVAALAAVVASRRRLYGQQSCRLSLAQRAWSVRRRGPPLLALG